MTEQQPKYPNCNHANYYQITEHKRLWHMTENIQTGPNSFSALILSSWPRHHSNFEEVTRLSAIHLYLRHLQIL